MVFGLMGSLAQFESSLISERIDISYGNA